MKFEEWLLYGKQKFCETAEEKKLIDTICNVLSNDSIGEIAYNNKYFVVTWEGFNNGIYELVKSLPNSRYSSGKVLVYKDSYDDVLHMAYQHKFTILPSAAAQIKLAINVSNFDKDEDIKKFLEGRSPGVDALKD